MNYKISTYVLSAMLIGTIIYSCKQDTNSSGALTTTAVMGDDQDSTLLSLEYAKVLKKEKSTRTSGRTITQEEAWDILDLYKRDRGITDCNNPSQDPRRIYGFSFGMDSMKEYMERIFKIDQQHPDSLIGIRVYYAMRADRNPQTNRMERRPDIFFIPIGKSGKAIHQIDDCNMAKSLQTRTDDGTIFDTSVPCPNRCE
jgi:hypothetical protein